MDLCSRLGWGRFLVRCSMRRLLRELALPFVWGWGLFIWWFWGGGAENPDEAIEDEL